MSGSSQIAPIGSRAAPVKPASDTRKMNFSQIGMRPSPTASAWMSAPTSACSSRAHAIGHPRQRAEDLAEDDAPMRAGLLDHARRGERRRDVGRAAEHRLLADRTAASVANAVDAVLQGQHRRPRAEHRRDRRQRRAAVVGLHRDDDDVDRADPAGVFFRGRVNGEVAERGTPDLQAPRADRLEVRAPGDERDVMTGTREPRTVVSADRTRPENRETHLWSIAETAGMVGVRGDVPMFPVAQSRRWSRRTGRVSATGDAVRQTFDRPLLAGARTHRGR